VKRRKINHLKIEGGPSDRSLELFLSVLLGAIGLLACVDVAIDLRHEGAGVHVLVETLIAAIALPAAALLIRLMIRRRRQLSRSLSAAEADAQRWRQDAQALIRGLGASIDVQFTRWTLTDAEKETALLLLKGLSHKQVAAARGTSDATARQQAGAVYRKAGVAGRSELAAFFLEDLALPAADQGAAAHIDPRTA